MGWHPLIPLEAMVERSQQPLTGCGGWHRYLRLLMWLMVDTNTDICLIEWPFIVSSKDPMVGWGGEQLRLPAGAFTAGERGFQYGLLCWRFDVLTECGGWKFTWSVFHISYRSFQGDLPGAGFYNLQLHRPWLELTGERGSCMETDSQSKILVHNFGIWVWYYLARQGLW